MRWLLLALLVGCSGEMGVTLPDGRVLLPSKCVDDKTYDCTDEWTTTCPDAGPEFCTVTYSWMGATGITALDQVEVLHDMNTGEVVFLGDCDVIRDATRRACDE